MGHVRNMEALGIRLRWLILSLSSFDPGIQITQSRYCLKARASKVLCRDLDRRGLGVLPKDPQ